MIWSLMIAAFVAPSTAIFVWWIKETLTRRAQVRRTRAALLAEVLYDLNVADAVIIEAQRRSKCDDRNFDDVDFSELHRLWSARYSKRAHDWARDNPDLIIEIDEMQWLTAVLSLLADIDSYFAHEAEQEIKPSLEEVLAKVRSRHDTALTRLYQMDQNAEVVTDGLGKTDRKRYVISVRRGRRVQEGKGSELPPLEKTFREENKRRMPSPQSWLLAGTHTVALIAGVALAVTLGPVLSRAEEAPKLAEVVDGDTIRVVQEEKEEPVRIIGLDTPESAKKANGKWIKTGDPCAAKATLRAFELMGNAKIELAADDNVPDRDKYDRLLRHVILPDGTPYSLVMIREGLATATHYQRHKYTSVLEAAELEAKTEGRGCVHQGVEQEKAPEKEP